MSNEMTQATESR